MLILSVLSLCTVRGLASYSRRSNRSVAACLMPLTLAHTSVIKRRCSVPVRPAHRKGERQGEGGREGEGERERQRQRGRAALLKDEISGSGLFFKNNYVRAELHRHN